MQIFRPDLHAHRVVIFSSNYPLYGGTFQRVKTTLREFGPNMEVYSIEEVFMGLHGMQEDWLGCGHKICNTLWRNIRMPVGVGIAPSKTLAKLANRMAKALVKSTNPFEPCGMSLAEAGCIVGLR